MKSDRRARAGGTAGRWAFSRPPEARTLSHNPEPSWGNRRASGLAHNAPYEREPGRLRAVGLFPAPASHQPGSYQPSTNAQLVPAGVDHPARRVAVPLPPLAGGQVKHARDAGGRPKAPTAAGVEPQHRPCPLDREQPGEFRGAAFEGPLPLGVGALQIEHPRRLGGAGPHRIPQVAACVGLAPDPAAELPVVEASVDVARLDVRRRDRKELLSRRDRSDRSPPGRGRRPRRRSPGSRHRREIGGGEPLAEAPEHAGHESQCRDRNPAFVASDQWEFPGGQMDRRRPSDDPPSEV